MIKKTHFKFFGMLNLCVLLSASCSSTGTRKPSSNGVGNLSSIIDEISEASEKHKLDPSVCKNNYDTLYQKLFHLAGDSAYLDMSDIKTMDEDIKESFLARIALKDSFKNFNAQGSVDNECLRAATDVFRGLRYVEDYLIEMRMEKSGTAPAEYVNLKGEFPYLLVNPEFENEFKSYEDLQSGDVILSRGNAFSSAAIARIGTNDYQFSHLSFVYKDAVTKQLYTTEAHIEIGSVVAPLIDHVGGKNAREVVFRFNNPEISSYASKYMRDRVYSFQEKKKNIEYDFSMNYKDDSRLFCSEIISAGFKAAMGHTEDYVPMFKSRFSKGIIPFLNTIGVPATPENVGQMQVFAPGDIQFDPRFDLVAEWRNPLKMEESRMKDFILTKFFERMDQAGYKVDPSFKMDAQAKTFWLLRRVPIVRKFIANKFPVNMNSGQLELFMAIDKIGDAIYKEVEKASLEYDRPMTPKEIFAVLDVFFKQDFDLYKRYKKGQDVARPAFHLLFHP